MSDVQLWRYTLRSQNGSGWAIFVLTSEGYFSSVSDFGSYAFVWNHHGCKDFREFLLGSEKDPHYFIGKLSPGKEYDGHSTLQACKDALKELRETDGLTAEQYDEELEALERYDVRDRSGHGFTRWVMDSDTKVPDAGELRCERHPRNVERFVREAMARLHPLLRADLEAK